MDVPGPDYVINVVESAPFDQNSYVLWKSGRDDALVIDPGFDTRSLLKMLDTARKRPAAILNTHGHIDHIAGNAALKAAFPMVPLIIGRNETALLGDPLLNLSAPYGMPFTSPAADRVVDDGDQLEFAGFKFIVREIPGHSPGSVIYFFSDGTPPFALGGDVLFEGSIGRTDLGGNLELLMSGIFSKLLTLPEETIVYPGHGPATTVGEEKRGNPFILEHSRRTRIG